MSLGPSVLSGVARTFSAEGRGRLADQRRGHVARVQVEADGEQDDEGGKAAERPE
jgi:hypothetical protein